MSRAFDPLILLLGSWLKKTLPAWNSLHNSLHTVTSVLLQRNWKCVKCVSVQQRKDIGMNHSWPFGGILLNC